MLISLMIGQLRKLGEVSAFLVSNLTDSDASLRKREVLSRWITNKIQEGSTSLTRAEGMLEKAAILNNEARQLDHLGEIAL